ncbi:MAG TPA: glycine C-acetyltransferase [Patescibacteria group bacterium]|nr:glycine C-acetyltransferase [Patescibacteria group bacterium]
MDKYKWIKEVLNTQKENNLYINFREIQSSMGSSLKVDGKIVINLCANNYLGLASDERLKKAAVDAIKKFGIGPAAVRTIAGTTLLHNELERKLAKFKKSQDVITFQSGFVANMAVIPILVSENDVIYSDELNHASIIDGCKLSKAEVIRYKHLDTKDLENKIKNRKLKTDTRQLIITDGVFSMDGDIAPLPEIVKVARKYNAYTFVDDAHGEGVLGNNGRGIVDHFNLHGQVDVEIGTLSKAFGVVGGFASGKKIIIDLLRQKARPFLFSSALTIPDTAAAIAAVDILTKSGSLVKKLWSNSDYFKSQMKNNGFDIGTSATPITPVMLGDEKLAKNFAKKLFENGIFATPITYPTVALGKARIRVMISASHSKKELDKAVKEFEKVGRDLNVI